MADANKVFEALKILLEFVWVWLRILFEVLKAVFRMVVPPEPKDVSGEIVLITGAGHGMGRELALRFSRLGAKVVIVDINEKGNEETLKMIQEDNGKVFKYEVDVTDREAVLKLAKKVQEQVGEVSILVNNAGIMPTREFLNQTERDVRLALDVNVNGYIWMTQAFLPSMLERNHGHLVSMSSMCGLVGSSYLVPYCATKFAVRGFMLALAAELHESERNTSGIKLTTICPYIVDTGLAKKPRIRFENALKMVDPGHAADMIVDAVRKEYKEITIPSDLYFVNKYTNLLPESAKTILCDFLASGVYPEDSGNGEKDKKG